MYMVGRAGPNVAIAMFVEHGGIRVRGQNITTNRDASRLVTYEEIENSIPRVNELVLAIDAVVNLLEPKRETE